MKFFKKILPLLILFTLSYWTIKPLFIPGFFPIHDDTQVQRVFEMKKTLGDGMFPVRWVADLGYGFGYPIFNFYAPLTYYIGGFLNLFGFDALTATKIMLGLAIVLSGLTMYYFTKEFWGKTGGIISGLLYLFAPYHAVNIFVRGDFSEVLAYAFIPPIFLGIYKISRLDKKWFWIIVSALSFAAIIISHNLTAMMVTPFIIAYALVLILSSKNNRKLLAINYSLFAILGLFLSAFYWLPALTEMKYTNVASQIGGGADFRDHFVCPMQLWESPWGFGGSTAGCTDGISFKIGKLHVVLAGLSLVILSLIWKKQKKIRTQIIFFVITLLVSIFFMLDISGPIWDAIPQMAYFQYPWRFLILASFTVSFLGGSFIYFLKLIITRQKYGKIVYLGLIAIVISAILLINAKLFEPQTVTNVSSNDFTNELDLKWKTSKISDEYMPKNFIKPKNKNEIPNSKFTAVNDKTKVEMLEDKTQQFSAKINTEKDTTMIINLAYFPSWHTYIDKSETSFNVFNRGLRVRVPKGEHILTVKFIQTPIEDFANILTITGIIAIFIGIISSRKGSKNAEKTT